MTNNNRSKKHVNALSLVFLLVLFSSFLLLKGDHSLHIKDPVEGSLTTITKLSGGLRGGGGGRSTGTSKGSGAKGVGGGSSRSPFGKTPFYGAAGTGGSGNRDHKHSEANNDARCSFFTMLAATILGTFIIAQYIM
ncbi:putative acrosin [Iris pallida]|uniref:Acrosin n=1 Tax=Iris pallida TaxID=29817 RepID=A0AAX6E211_IRIPA|nr:putative acrosin [Iris pallida]